MKRHKDFSAGPRNREPITFTIEDQAFSAKSMIPGATLLDFVKDVDGEGGAAAAALVDFITASLIEADRDRFTSLIHDDNVSVQIETLGAICEWLVTEYTARPTQLPSTSPVTLTQSGSGSMVPVSETVSIS